MLQLLVCACGGFQNLGVTCGEETDGIDLDGVTVRFHYGVLVLLDDGGINLRNVHLLLEVKAHSLPSHMHFAASCSLCDSGICFRFL